MNKKGLATGIIITMMFLFIFALSSIISLTMWNSFNNAIQTADNTTIPSEVKQQVNDLTSMFLWGDKLFIIFFIALLISYLISSVTVPVDKPIFFIIFVFVLIFTTIMAMILSNAWTYLIGTNTLYEASKQLKMTDYFMRYLPIITFFIGIIGAILFYGRKKTDFNAGGNPYEFE